MLRSARAGLMRAAPHGVRPSAATLAVVGGGIVVLCVWTLARVFGNKALPGTASEGGAASHAAESVSVSRIGGNKARLTKYAAMTKTFLEKGLDTGAIEKARANFGGFDEKDWVVVWPKQYKDNGLCYPCVRLLVMPLEPFPSFAAKAGAASREVMAALPGFQVHANGRSSYHITLFHTSHPDSVRPLPMTPGGGVGPGIKYPSPPVGTDLEREKEEMAAAAGAGAPPTLELHRITMTPSGTLLALWTEEGGVVDGLRKSLRGRFPGASSIQADTIIHTTLLRVLSPEPIPKAKVEELEAICAKYTEMMAGTKITPRHMWFVLEKEFGTLEGERIPIPFRG